MSLRQVPPSEFGLLLEQMEVQIGEDEAADSHAKKIRETVERSMGNQGLTPVQEQFIGQIERVDADERLSTKGPSGFRIPYEHREPK